jgi:hypothetical protein
MWRAAFFPPSLHPVLDGGEGNRHPVITPQMPTGRLIGQAVLHDKSHGQGHDKVDGTVVDSHPMPRSLPITNAWDEYFNVGLDTGTSVDDQDYQVPFRFTGKIDKLTVKLGPVILTPEDAKKVKEVTTTWNQADS